MSIQRAAKVGATGLVNFVPAVAYHFCLALPAVFTQPGDNHLGEPCRVGFYICEACYVLTLCAKKHASEHMTTPLRGVPIRTYRGVIPRPSWLLQGRYLHEVRNILGSFYPLPNHLS